MTTLKIHPLINDLEERLTKVCAVKESIIQIYNQKTLFNSTEKLGVPAIGIVYAGMRPTGNKGLTTQVVLDIYLIGGDECKGDSIPDTVAILDEMRDVIVCEANSSGRKWEFLLETPHQFDKRTMAYVQRWATTVLLTR